MKRAFTLVELLVVVAIIVLLAAILLPVYRSARAAVAKVRCVSGLKQIGTAARLYADDYDETYPPGAYCSVAGGQKWDRSWHDLLAGYVRSWGPFVCPGAPAGSTPRTSYGCNRFISGWRFGLRDSLVPIPAETVYLTEKRNEDWAFYALSEWQLPHWRPLDPRHNRRVNCLFCDGHVGAEKPEDLIVAQVKAND